MGFWDTFKEIAKDVGKAAYNSMEENALKMEEYQDEYDRMSVEQLKREYMRYKNGQIHNAQKLAAFKKVCRDKGLIKD